MQPIQLGFDKRHYGNSLLEIKECLFVGGGRGHWRNRRDNSDEPPAKAIKLDRGD